MGIGAEIGTYYRNLPNATVEKNVKGFFEYLGICDDIGNLEINQTTGHFWSVDNADMSFLEFTLYDGRVSEGKVILTRPLQCYWWLNGFRPGIDVDVSNLTVKGYILFSTEKRAQAFIDGLQSVKHWKHLEGNYDNANFKPQPVKPFAFDQYDQFYEVSFTWGKE